MVEREYRVIINRKTRGRQEENKTKKRRVAVKPKTEVRNEEKVDREGK